MDCQTLTTEDTNRWVTVIVPPEAADRLDHNAQRGYSFCFPVKSGLTLETLRKEIYTHAGYNESSKHVLNFYSTLNYVKYSDDIFLDNLVSEWTIVAKFDTISC